MTSSWISGLMVGAVALCAYAAEAAIVSVDIVSNSTGGSFEQKTIAPTDAFPIGNTDLQSDDLIVFDEDQGLTLPADVTFEVGGTIPMGTKVNSHFVSWNPDTLDPQVVTAEITFDGPILGVATIKSELDATRPLISNALMYNVALDGGIERNTPATPTLKDILPPPTGSTMLSLSLSATEPGDLVRVFTAPAQVPLPASGFVLLAAMGAAVGTRRLGRNR